MNAVQGDAAWHAVKRILCVRLDRMGDVLMATPAIRALKHSQAARHVTLLTSASGAAVARLVPDIDQVISYAAPWMKDPAPHDCLADLAAIETLRAGRFDAAVIFTSYSQSALPAALHCYLAGIPLRLAHARENPYRLLSHWVAEREPEQMIRHEVRRQLDLVQSIGSTNGDERLALRVGQAAIAGTRERLRVLGLDPSRPWLLLHPGASASSRRYPAQQWAQVVDQLVARKFQVVLSGSLDERRLLDQITLLAAGTISVLAVDFDLEHFAAMVSLAPVLIANNTGPVHIAAAVGTPVVDLYALTNPQHTPWQVPCRVLYEQVPCAFCYKSECPQQHQHCLTKVTPQRVVEAAMQLHDLRL